jgi:hypothetical protein
VSLFHVSADMRWSDLPMSGSFVEMLRRIVDSVRLHVANPGAGVAGERTVPKRWRRCARSMVSARSGRRPRPPSRCRRLPGPGERRSSARILRPGRRPAGGEYAGGGGPHRAARYLGRCARAGQLHQCRTAGSARNPAVVSLALFLIDAIIVAMLGAGIAALLRRRRRPAWHSPFRPVAMLAGAVAVPRRRATMISPSRRSRKPGSPMSSPATPTSIPSSRRAWQD